MTQSGIEPANFRVAHIFKYNSINFFFSKELINPQKYASVLNQTNGAWCLVCRGEIAVKIPGMLSYTRCCIGRWRTSLESHGHTVLPCPDVRCARTHTHTHTHTHTRTRTNAFHTSSRTMRTILSCVRAMQAFGAIRPYVHLSTLRAVIIVSLGLTTNIQF